MSLRNSVKRPELKWEVMDVLNMRFASNFFDLIIDKSTIDALLCGELSFMNTALMMRECQRVLKPDAAYLCVSYGTPENRVLHYKRGHLKLSVQTFQVAPCAPLKEGQSIHYVYVCRKIEGADDMAAEKWPEVEA
jgi:ubiquinone/menaquinone biosynthesis C-methylase UbiE